MALKYFHKKKQYLEFFTALLSIPVLITVIILNLNSLNNINKDKKPTPTPSQVSNTFYGVPIDTAKTVSISPTTGPCKKGIGPISITSPEEKEVVTDNPANVMISYQDDVYCGVVWSYRINGGPWSEYDDKSFALYNLPQGDIKFELRVKSLANKDQKDLSRSFVYKGTSVMPTNNPTLQISPTIQEAVQGTSSAK